MGIPSYSEFAAFSGRWGLDPQTMARVQPVTLAQPRVLAVPDALMPIFPYGGLSRGLGVAFAGQGAWSVAMAIWAEGLAEDGWLALVGLPDVNLVAAAELGIQLDRVLMIGTPPAQQWASVVAALCEAVDVIAVAPAARVNAQQARRVMARCREHDAVICHLGSLEHWPEPVDLTIQSATAWQDWSGIGEGHGFLQQRHVHVTISGRRAHSQTRSVSLAIPPAPHHLWAASQSSLAAPQSPLRSVPPLSAASPLPSGLPSRSLAERRARVIGG